MSPMKLIKKMYIQKNDLIYTIRVSFSIKIDS